MNCLNCKTEMKCIDDVNEISVRIDWEECPVCKSQAEIIFDRNDMSIEKIIWTKGAKR